MQPITRVSFIRTSSSLLSHLCLSEGLRLSRVQVKEASKASRRLQKSRITYLVPWRKWGGDEGFPAVELGVLVTGHGLSTFPQRNAAAEDTEFCSKSMLASSIVFLPKWGRVHDHVSIHGKGRGRPTTSWDIHKEGREHMPPHWEMTLHRAPREPHSPVLPGDSISEQRNSSNMLQLICTPSTRGDPLRP